MAKSEGETVNYTYDAPNRLTSAQEASGKWGNAFAYDGWGNMNNQTYTPGYTLTEFNSAPPGPGADPDGNLIGSPTNPYYQYDVENRLIWQSPSVGGWTPSNQWSPALNWGYDPWGRE